MYESTMDGLVHLYPRLAVGGYLIVDDYGCHPGCQQAGLDYRAAWNIEEPISSIDLTGVYWKRTWRPDGKIAGPRRTAGRHSCYARATRRELP